MDEQQATAVANALGGETWQTGGGIYLVLIKRRGGGLVVISDEVICEYPNEDAFEKSEAVASIILV